MGFPQWNPLDCLPDLFPPFSIIITDLAELSKNISNVHTISLPQLNDRYTVSCYPSFLTSVYDYTASMWLSIVFLRNLKITLYSVLSGLWILKHYKLFPTILSTLWVAVSFGIIFKSIPGVRSNETQMNICYSQ